MKKRDCGSCVACCEGWLNSKIMNLSPGNPCPDCTEQGCGIYETRPEDPCRSFICGWLQEDSPLPDNMRPDLSGAIVRFERKWRGNQTITAIPVGAKIPQETLDWLMAYAREQQIPLIFLENFVKEGRFSGWKKTGYGPPAFVEEVKTSININDIVRL